MPIDEELNAYAGTVAASSPSPLRLRPGVPSGDVRLAGLPAEIAGIWEWRDGQNVDAEFAPHARFLPLEDAARDGAAVLQSRRALPEHPDQRPGASWLAFVSDGKLAHIIEHGPEVVTQALVFDPSGFIDDYPIIPVPELPHLWHTTAASGARSYDGDTWRIDHGKYPDEPARRLLLV